MTGWNKRVVCLAMLERSRVGLFPVFDDDEKGTKRGKRESKEEPRVWPSWSCHELVWMNPIIRQWISNTTIRLIFILSVHAATLMLRISSLSAANIL